MNPDMIKRSQMVKIQRKSKVGFVKISLSSAPNCCSVESEPRRSCVAVVSLLSEMFGSIPRISGAPKTQK